MRRIERFTAVYITSRQASEGYGPMAGWLMYDSRDIYRGIIRVKGAGREELVAALNIIYSTCQLDNLDTYVREIGGISVNPTEILSRSDFVPQDFVKTGRGMSGTEIDDLDYAKGKRTPPADDYRNDQELASS